MNKKGFFSFLALCFFVQAFSIDTPKKSDVSVAPIFINQNIFDANFVFNMYDGYVKKAAEHATEYAKSVAGSIKKTMWENRYKLGLAGIASIYAGTQAVLAALILRLDKETCWSFWMGDVCLEQLCLISQKELGQDLVRAIQSTYMYADNPMDTVRQFMLFLEDVEKERTFLTTYLRIARVLQITCIDYISLVSQERCDSYTQRLDRLAYLEHVFADWVSDYTFGERLLAW